MLGHKAEVLSGDPPCQPAHQMKSAVSYSEHDLLIFSSDFCGKKKPNNNKKLDCVFTLRYSSQRRAPFISRPRFKAGEFDSFNRWAFVLDRGCTCVLRLCFHPLIGPAEAPSPSNGPAAAMQRCSGSGHVWRQMEPGSVSGLPEMSLTSAARKESGHRRSGITRWNKKKKEESV